VRSDVDDAVMSRYASFSESTWPGISPKSALACGLCRRSLPVDVTEYAHLAVVPRIGQARPRKCTAYAVVWISMVQCF
jgi:hypothetical protein